MKDRVRGDTAVTDARHPPPLRGYRLSGPPTWAALPAPGSTAPGWEDALVAELSRGEPAAAALRHDLGVLYPALATPQRLRVGVWVPDPDCGEVIGVMAVDLLLPEEGVTRTDLDAYQRAITTTSRPGVTVMDRKIRRGRVPAGPCLLSRETVTAGHAVVVYHVIVTVFPPGSRDALELAFCTPHGSYGGQLEQDARRIAHSLVLIPQPS